MGNLTSGVGRSRPLRKTLTRQFAARFGASIVIKHHQNYGWIKTKTKPLLVEFLLQ